MYNTCEFDVAHLEWGGARKRKSYAIQQRPYGSIFTMCRKTISTADVHCIFPRPVGNQKETTPATKQMSEKLMKGLHPNVNQVRIDIQI